MVRNFADFDPMEGKQCETEGEVGVNWLVYLTIENIFTTSTHGMIKGLLRNLETSFGNNPESVALSLALSMADHIFMKSWDNFSRLFLQLWIGYFLANLCSRTFTIVIFHFKTVVGNCFLQSYLNLLQPFFFLLSWCLQCYFNEKITASGKKMYLGIISLICCVCVRQNWDKG